MAKVFKRIALLLTVALSVVCMCVFASACNDDEKENNNATGYSITVVYPDNKAVNGTTDGKAQYDPDDKTVKVQICVVLANGETGSCFDMAQLDANGKATLKAPDYTLKEGEKFKIQVNNVPEGYKCDKARTYYSSANYVTAPGSYTVTLEVE